MIYAISRYENFTMFFGVWFFFFIYKFDYILKNLLRKFTFSFFFNNIIKKKKRWFTSDILAAPGAKKLTRPPPSLDLALCTHNEYYVETSFDILNFEFCVSNTFEIIKFIIR